MIDYRTPPLGYLVRVPQESVDSSLDSSARLRAEEAARWLSFQNFGRVISRRDIAAAETAEIINSARGIGERMEWDDEYPISADLAVLYAGFSAFQVLVCDGLEISAIIEALTGADVCGEIVAPGGIVSIHRSPEIPSGSEGALPQPGFIAIARTMILDFSFTDFVDAVTAGDDRGPSPETGSGF